MMSRLKDVKRFLSLRNLALSRVRREILERANFDIEDGHSDGSR